MQRRAGKRPPIAELVRRAGSLEARGIVMGLPLDGEGRTIGYSKEQNSVAVGFPDSPDAAVEAIYVLSHEIVNAITTTAINDNVTPAEQRSGAVARSIVSAAP